MELDLFVYGIMKELRTQQLPKLTILPISCNTRLWLLESKLENTE